MQIEEIKQDAEGDNSDNGYLKYVEDDGAYAFGSERIVNA
jgi:hypothetical protein